MFQLGSGFWFWLMVASWVPLCILAIFYGVSREFYKNWAKEWEDRWESGREARSGSEALFHKKIKLLRGKLERIREILDEEED